MLFIPSFGFFFSCPIFYNDSGLKLKKPELGSGALRRTSVVRFQVWSKSKLRSVFNWYLLSTGQIQKRIIINALTTFSNWTPFLSLTLQSSGNVQTRIWAVKNWKNQNQTAMLDMSLMWNSKPLKLQAKTPITTDNKFMLLNSHFPPKNFRTRLGIFAWWGRK